MPHRKERLHVQDPTPERQLIPASRSQPEGDEIFDRIAAGLNSLASMLVGEGETAAAGGR